MGVFYETAFWGFLALVAALITVIYKLFSSKVDSDLMLKLAEAKEELKVHFKNEFVAEIKELKADVRKMSDELASFKRHEDNNSKIQVGLTKKLLSKLDILDKIDPELLAKTLEGESD